MIRNLSLRNSVGFTIITIFAFLSPPGIFRYLKSFIVGGDPLDQAIRNIIFITAFWFMGWCLLIAGSLSTRFAKWIIFGMISISFTVFYTYQVSMNQTLNYDGWLVLWNARAFISDAFNEYGHNFVYSIPWIVFLYVGFLLVNTQFKFAIPIIILSFFATTTSFLLVIFLKGGRTTEYFPPTTSLYGLFAAQFFDSNTSKTILYETTDHPKRRPFATHIILIIDESVRYDFFKNYVKPKLNISQSKWQPYDFGLTTAMSNCSASTNIMIRRGAQAISINDDLYSHPLIWSYAKNANFKTWLIDAQRHGIGHNHFNSREIKMIDHIPTTNWINDSDIIEDLNYLKNNQNTFTFLIKRGAHFPYTKKFPQDYSLQIDWKHQPAYIRDNIMRQDYIKAIDYQTAVFLDKLLTLQISQPTIILYTSDHGQNIQDQEASTHCNVSRAPSEDEAAVPFIIFTNFHSPIFFKASTNYQNQMSHFDIMPWIYFMLGYKSDQLPKPVSTSKFLYGTPSPHFGQPVKWQTFDRDKYLQILQNRWQSHSP